MVLLAPTDVEIVFCEELERIPPFNPDLDVEPAAEAVANFRMLVKSSDAVVFSTPEYAHGVPGSLKNLLDWVVGSGELSDKPVALIHASAQGEHAKTSLRETLRTMNARVLEEVEHTVSLRGKKLTADQLAADAEQACVIRGFVKELADRLSVHQAPQPVLGSAAGIGGLENGWDSPLTDAALGELIK